MLTGVTSPYCCSFILQFYYSSCPLNARQLDFLLINNLVCGVPGAHVNPAVSLAMVILGKLPVKKFPVYVLAQFLGAFAGSCAVYGLYYGGCMSCISTK